MKTNEKHATNDGMRKIFQCLAIAAAVCQTLANARAAHVTAMTDPETGQVWPVALEERLAAGEGAADAAADNAAAIAELASAVTNHATHAELAEAVAPLATTQALATVSAAADDAYNMAGTNATAIADLASAATNHATHAEVAEAVAAATNHAVAATNVHFSQPGHGGGNKLAIWEFTGISGGGLGTENYELGLTNAFLIKEGAPLNPGTPSTNDYIYRGRVTNGTSSAISGYEWVPLEDIAAGTDTNAIISAVEGNDFASLTLGGETITQWPSGGGGGGGEGGDFIPATLYEQSKVIGRLTFAATNYAFARGISFTNAPSNASMDSAMAEKPGIWVSGAANSDLQVSSPDFVHIRGRGVVGVGVGADTVLDDSGEFTRTVHLDITTASGLALRNPTNNMRYQLITNWEELGQYGIALQSALDALEARVAALEGAEE